MKKNKETFDSFKKVGAAATAGGVAVAGGLAFAVKKAEEFESGMSSVAAVAGLTGKEGAKNFELLTNTAREWGASTSFSATEAAKGLEYMALAGWDTQQMMGGIGPILHLAEAGALDLGRASDLVTDSMAGLGLGVKDLSGYLDKVATTAANSNTDIDALMEAFVIAGGTFDRFNVPLEESSAFLGVLANRGFKASEAGTAINAIMTRLASSTGPAAKKLKEMGISAYDSEGNFRGMEAVLEDVRGKMDKMTDAEKANAMEKLAGLNHGKTFNAMLAGLGDEYQDLKGKIVDSEGALLQMRNTMKDNLSGDLENLSSAFEEIAISIGTVLLPHVKTMIEFIQSLADKFNSLDEKTMTIIAIVAALAAGFLLLIGPIFLLIGFIPSMLAGFTALSTVIGVLTGPIALTIAAIIAIGVALVVAYNKFEWFRNVVDTVWQAIVNAIMSAVDGVVAFVKDIASQISTYWNENGEMIRAATDNVWEVIQKIIQTVMPIIEKTISLAWKAIQIVVKGVWENVKGVIQGALDIIMGLVKVFAGLFTGNWSAMWDGVKQILSGALSLIWNLFNLMLYGRLVKGVMALFKSITALFSTGWNAIRSSTSTAFSSINSIVTSVINAIRSFITGGLNSIKNVFMTIWRAIYNTLKSIVTNMGTAVRNGLVSMYNVVSSILGTIRGVFSTIWNGVLSYLRGLPAQMLGIGRDLIRGLINGIKNMAGAAVSAITGVVDGVVNKAKSLLGIASPSKLFTKIGEWIGLGQVKGILSTKRANQVAMEGVSNALVTVAENHADEINKIDKDARLERWKVHTDSIAKDKDLEVKAADSIQKIRKTASDKNRSLTVDESKKIQAIRKDLSLNLQKLERDSLEKVESINKKARAEKLKLDEGLSKQRLDAIKHFIDDKKSLEELDMVTEARIWEQSLSQFEKGTKERVEAQKSYKNAVEAVKKEITSINQEYSDKMQKINDDLAANEYKLNDEYNKAYESRVDAIRNFAGMFDEFVASMDKSGQDLIKNLQSQVTGLEDWRSTLDSLWGKIDDQSLMEELEAMGPKALGELQALNSLSASELSQYVDLYNQKFALAREQATHELSGMKDDTKSSITDLRNAANVELDKVEKEWVKKIESITKATDDELKTLKSVGINAGKGLLEGLSSMEGALVSKARSIANAVKSAMAGALDIHSPSRWMRDMIGKNMMLGWIQGMEAMRSNVLAVANNATQWMIPEMPTLSGINLPSFSNDSTRPSSSSTRGSGSGRQTGGGDVIQHITLVSPKPTSPSDNARMFKQAQRQLGMDL